MTPPGNPENIVKKVFDRPAPVAPKASPLFTHFKKAPGRRFQELKAGSLPPLALDIGSSSIKLLQLSAKSDVQPEIVAIDEEPFGGPAETPLAQRQFEALRRLRSRNATSARVVLSVPAKEAQIYNLLFPPMSETDLGEAVKWKLSQLKPFGQDIKKIKHAFTQWKTPAVGGRPPQQRVFVACLAAESVAEKVWLLKQVGFKPFAMELSAFSLAHLSQLKSLALPPEEMVMWLDFGAEETTMMLERKGVVHFFRSLSVTSRQWTRQIAQACRVDEEQAERLKHQEGLSFWTPERQEAAPEEARETPALIFRALSASLENLLVDVEHSFKYFSYQLTQSEITRFDRVVLAGSGANLKSLDRFLGARLGVPVEKVHTFGDFRISEKVRGQRAPLLDNPGGFAAAMGLAASDFLGRSGSVNFFTGIEVKPGGLVLKKAADRPSTMLVAAVIALLFLTVVPASARMMYYKKESDKAAAELKKNQKLMGDMQNQELRLAEEETKLTNEKKDLEYKLKVLRQAARPSRGFSEKMASISGLLPEDIWINQLAYSKEKLTLVGSSPKSDMIVKVIEDLKKSKDFTDVVYNYTNKEADTSVYSFEVAMDVV